jgi:ribosomal protein S18 acetylase RimI-like enzyme
MTPQSAKLKEQPAGTTSLSLTGHSLTAHRLTDEHQTEVLRFLEERPLHTVVMNGFIRDYGLESSLNRGTFYACRNVAGKLEGVALLGHAIFLDARNDSALRLFARLAQDCHSTHMIMGEQETIGDFWKYYSESGRLPRRFCRELLFELASPAEIFTPVPNLRRAAVADLAQVMPVHASLAYEESGVNPLEVDPRGFRLRCQRRIERGRVWVWIEDGQLIFKADVISDTPGVLYVEGVYVNPNERRKGYGSRCMSQMSHRLTRPRKSITVLVNETQPLAQRFFQRVGFVARGVHETIFLDKNYKQ